MGLARRSQGTFCANLVGHLATRLASRGFVERPRFADNQFVRARCLSAPRLVVFLLNLVQGALQVEVDRFFEHRHGVGESCRTVTRAAVSLARRQRHFAACIELNQEVVAGFYGVCGKSVGKVRRTL